MYLQKFKLLQRVIYCNFLHQIATEMSWTYTSVNCTHHSSPFRIDSSWIKAADSSVSNVDLSGLADYMVHSSKATLQKKWECKNKLCHDTRLQWQGRLYGLWATMFNLTKSRRHCSSSLLLYFSISFRNMSKNRAFNFSVLLWLFTDRCSR